MGYVSVFIVSLLLAIIGIVIGFRIGQELALHCETKRQYWAMNAICYVVGIVASAFIWAFGFVVLVFATIGLLGGAIAGLKFGFGSEGPWKKVDKWMGVKNKHLDAKPRPEGEEEPELMSVADPGPTQDRKTRRGK